jgi:hypothetical protein
MRASGVLLLAAGARAFQLEFVPAPQLNGFHNASLKSWGGSVLKDGEDYHLFASAFANDCGLGSWGQNSIAIHAVGPSALGPFAFVDRALPYYSHNVHPIVAPDGTVLIFKIGMSPDPTPSTCRPGGTREPPPLEHGFETVEAWAAPSVNGPFAPVAGGPPNGRVIFNGTNPAPAFDPSGNGTLYVMSHTSGSFTVSVAPSWRGPYSSPRSVFTSTVGDFVGEDPLLWWDATIANSEGGVGAWRVLYHAYNMSDPHVQFAVGGYAQSAGADIFGSWTVQDPSTEPAYTTQFTTYVSGAAGPTTTTTFSRRERPKLFWDSTGAPAVLYSGVCPEPDGDGDCFTIAAPIA